MRIGSSAFTAALVFIAALPHASAPAWAASAPASAAPTKPCALHVQTIAAVDDRAYAVILRSDERISDVHLNLYSEANDYAIALPAVHFEPAASPPPETKSGMPLAPAAGFESAPIFVVLPKVDIITGARAELSDASLQGEKACYAMYGYTDFYMRLLNPAHATSAESRALKLDLARAYGRGAPTVTALVTIARTSANGKGCPVRASAAITTRPVEPDYPAAARAAGATGSVQIFVSLDAAGRVVETGVYKSSGNIALDDAARRAAQNSTYRAEIFRCESIPGTYLFRADFNRR